MQDWGTILRRMPTLKNKIYREIQRICAFGLVSGIGLGIDTGGFLCLVHFLYWPPFVANALSMFSGATFVFFVSGRYVFARHRASWIGYILYILFQGVLIWGASFAVGWLIVLGVMPLISKMLILPVTFSCNYLYMRWLLGFIDRHKELRNTPEENISE